MASKKRIQFEDLETDDLSQNANADVHEMMEDDDRDHVLQAVDELADRGLEIERLQDELAQTTDQLKRQAAEFQNYRRRTEQEKAQAVSLGKSIVIQKLLDVVDDFYRSLEATKKAEEEASGDLSPAYVSLKNGVDLVYQKLMDELSRLNVIPMETVGMPFNEDEHEALMQQPAEEGQEAGIVVSEIQRGFRMGDKVLRHARVIVSA
jgi:molecular chaperone GrpE